VEMNPRDEMDMLLDSQLGFAQEMLSKHGEFYPFAAHVNFEGELALVSGTTGEEKPLSDDVIDVLYAGLCRQAEAGEIRAAAVCADVLVEPPGGSGKTDAIRVDIEHSHSDPVRVFLPYEKNRRSGLILGELFAARGNARVFSRSES